MRKDDWRAASATSWWIAASVSKTFIAVQDPFHAMDYGLICLVARDHRKAAYQSMDPIAPPKEREQTAVDSEALAKQIPRYHVVLLDDEDHTYEYVIEMLMRLFRHGRETAWKMAWEVDHRGRSIVYTTNKEQAEHKRSQIQSYGADRRLSGSKGSMSAVVEKAD